MQNQDGVAPQSCLRCKAWSFGLWSQTFMDIPETPISRICGFQQGFLPSACRWEFQLPQTKCNLASASPDDWDLGIPGKRRCPQIGVKLLGFLELLGLVGCRECGLRAWESVSNIARHRIVHFVFEEPGNS